MRSSVALALSLVAGGWFFTACAPPADGASPAPRDAVATRVLLPVGRVGIDVDSAQVDEKMGDSFGLGLRSGANSAAGVGCGDLDTDARA